MNRLENVRATLLPALKVELKGNETLWTKRDSVLCLQVDPSEKDAVRQWLLGWTMQDGWRELPVALELRKWYRKKTLDQLGIRGIYASASLKLIQRAGFVGPWQRIRGIYASASLKPTGRDGLFPS